MSICCKTKASPKHGTHSNHQHNTVSTKQIRHTRGTDQLARGLSGRHMRRKCL